jgi:uncharacterized protein (DUF697 family)
MPNPLKLASLWRIISDVDLEGPRRAARAKFTISIVAESAADAEAVRRLLTGAGAAAHPWVETGAPRPGEPLTPELLAGLAGTPLVGIMVTRSQDLSPALKMAGNRFATAAAPVLTVVIGHTSGGAKIIRPGERARVAVETIDDAGAVEAVATALSGIVSDDQQVALAAHLPPLRSVLSARLIDRTARANASFALTTGLAETIPVLTAPLNLGDMVVLTKNQLMMCYRLALMAGRDDEPRAMMGEIIGVLGSGVLFRQIARQLVGLIPVAGLLPKVAIAYAGTYAIGRAMVAWTTEGRQITVDTVSTYTREGLVRGRALAEHLVDEAGATGGRVARRFERFRRFLPGKRRSTSDV